MAKDKDDKKAQPAGGHAAERLKMFQAARGIKTDTPDAGNKSKSDTEQSPHRDQESKSDAKRARRED